jgi:N-acetylmuramic acid 6-phosphate (MurNAc-6-P) etherase
MKRRKKPPPTERSNPRTRRIDRLTSRQVVELLNVEDARVPAAVRRTLPQVARAVEAIVEGPLSRCLLAGCRQYWREDEKPCFIPRK